MIGQVSRLRAIAEANDDPVPDHLCPGCGALVVEVTTAEAHTPDGRPTPKTSPVDFCPWDSDMLEARRIRRAVLRGEW